MQSVSVSEAIRRGLVMAYAPFFPLVAGVPLLALVLAQPLGLPTAAAAVGLPVGLAAAWIWWSYRVPQWRLWALQRVEDIDALHRRAVQVGIEWPYGSIFERTEISSREHLRREMSLQLRYYLQRTQAILSGRQGGYHTDLLREELGGALGLLIADLPRSPHTLTLLQQHLAQHLFRPAASAAEIAEDAIIGAALHFIAKYQRVAR